MILITQDGLVTVTSPWWFSMRIGNDKKTLLLETAAGENEPTSLVIAKYKTQKQIVALYKAINFALSADIPSFNIKTWESENSI